MLIDPTHLEYGSLRKHGRGRVARLPGWHHTKLETTGVAGVKSESVGGAVVSWTIKTLLSNHDYILILVSAMKLQNYRNREVGTQSIRRAYVAD